MFSTGEHQSAFKNSRRTVESWAQIKMPLAFCARAQPMSAELATRSARAFLPFLPNSDLEGDNKRGSERAPGASRATGSRPQVSTHVHSTALHLTSSDRLQGVGLRLNPSCKWQDLWFEAVHGRWPTFLGVLFALWFGHVWCVNVCRCVRTSLASWPGVFTVSALWSSCARADTGFGRLCLISVRLEQCAGFKSVTSKRKLSTERGMTCRGTVWTSGACLRS